MPFIIYVSFLLISLGNISNPVIGWNEITILIHFHFVPQIDILEDPVIKNVIVLQTVLQEVRHRSAPVYKRIRDVIQNPEKHFYSFTNEHHR